MTADKHVSIKNFPTARFMAGIGRPFRNLLPLVLASASPRRLEFLSATGLDFHVLPSPEAEPVPEPGETASAFALRSARAKAQAVAGLCASRPEFGSAIILAADTVVQAPDGRLLGKPVDTEQALGMLTSLFGVKDMTHRVITGCHITTANPCPAKNLPTDLSVTSLVTAHGWEPAVLKAYAQCDEVMDKAGAYAIQGQGVFLIKEIRGSFSNVIGLPVAEVLACLVAGGVIAPCE